LPAITPQSPTAIHIHLVLSPSDTLGSHWVAKEIYDEGCHISARRVRSFSSIPVRGIGKRVSMRRPLSFPRIDNRIWCLTGSEVVQFWVCSGKSIYGAPVLDANAAAFLA